jgi:ribonucleoside-diphosphate reductase alpha chain
MNFELVESVCRDPNARIPRDIRESKEKSAKFLLASSRLASSEIKNSGWWAIKRWLDEDASSDDYDEIVSIEKLAEERTYDLTVPDGNSFSANGFSVHNCNLPNSATKETVNDVYLKAWKTGCKGFTVYRDGCRTGVLVQVDEPKKEQKKPDDGRLAPKRPKSIPCDIHRATIRNNNVTESWLVLVGHLEGKPYEVFCGIPENIEIPKKYKAGELCKNGKRDGVTTYNLLVPVGDDDNLVFKDVVNLFDNPTQGAFTRTISLALRHGVPLQYVVEQLQKDKNSDMFSYARVIARVLKGYIKDGTTSTEKGCPDCGNVELVYQEGCLSCKSCSWSRCK